MARHSFHQVFSATEHPARENLWGQIVARLGQMQQCHDELPPAEPELPLVIEEDVRLGIEDRIHAAWTDFHAREWMGATLFAGAAMTYGIIKALARRGDTMRCPACHGAVRPHKQYSDGARPHFEHLEAYSGCPTKPKTYSGRATIHPHALR